MTGLIQRMRQFLTVRWTDAQVLAAEVDVDWRVARRWLPTGLRLAHPARATLFIADYPETSFGSVYREAAVLLQVRLGPLRAVHCPWMLVDDDVALVLGREVLGYPKKLGEMHLTRVEDRIQATARRHDTLLLDLRGRVGPVLAQPPPLFAQRTVNV